MTSFWTWNFGNHSVITITGKVCDSKQYTHEGCGHQWGLIYSMGHEVICDTADITLHNLDKRGTRDVYDVSFWTFYRE